MVFVVVGTHTKRVREGCEKKKNRKKSVSMQNHSRTPKTCFTLGLKLFEYISSFKNYFESVTEQLFEPG